MRYILLLPCRELLHCKVLQKLERREMYKNLSQRAQEFMLRRPMESSVDSWSCQLGKQVPKGVSWKSYHNDVSL